MLELELKLAVEGPFAPRLPPGRTEVAGIEELAPLDLRATYYDTSDLRLARNGVTVRHRTGEGERDRWSVKLPTEPGDITGRDELHFEGAARSVPGEALDLVTAFARSAPLAPVARLRTRRRRWTLRGGEGQELAELVDDRVSVLHRGRVVERFREVEIEGRALDRAGLEQIAGVLAESAAATVASVPKVVRALGERAAAPPDASPSERVAPDDAAAQAVGAAIARGLQRMVANDPRTRLGEVEPLHQMRVGTRRLRSDLRTFAPLLDEQWTESLRRELGWVGAALGAVRDLDVLRERLSADAGPLEADLEPLFEALMTRRSVARSDMLAALRSARFVDLLDRLVDAANEPALTAAAQDPCAAALPPLVAGSWRKLARNARALGDASPDEEFHRVRRLAKRARYAAEAVAPALAPRQAERAREFARRAAGVQEVLGELQDSVIARDMILEVAARHPRSGSFNLAAGRMLEREEGTRLRCRAQFPQAWERLDRGKLTRWMRP